MEAISGTRRAMKEMADGTIRVQVDIDPSCRLAFLSLFPSIDMPVALAPLRADFETAGQAENCRSDEKLQDMQDRPKGGELARLAGQLCQNPEFLNFHGFGDEGEAAEHVRFVCQIDSRAELDHNQEAAQTFHTAFRKPFAVWKGGR